MNEKLTSTTNAPLPPLIPSSRCDAQGNWYAYEGWTKDSTDALLAEIEKRVNEITYNSTDVLTVKRGRSLLLSLQAVRK